MGFLSKLMGSGSEKPTPAEVPPPRHEFTIGGVNIVVKPGFLTHIDISASGDAQDREYVLEIILKKLKSSYSLSSGPTANGIDMYPGKGENPKITLSAVQEVCQYYASKITDKFALDYHRKAALNAQTSPTLRVAEKQSAADRIAEEATRPYLDAVNILLSRRNTPLSVNEAKELRQTFLDIHRGEKGKGR